MSLCLNARPGAAERLDDRVSTRFSGFMNTSDGALWLRAIMWGGRHVCLEAACYEGLSAPAIIGPRQMTSYGFLL